MSIHASIIGSGGGGGGVTSLVGLSGSRVSGSGALTVKSPSYADASATGTSTLNSGEFVTGAFTRTLPATAGLADGDLVEYVCTSAAVLTIQTTSPQQIKLGSATTAAGGSISSTAIGDSISLRFRAADGFFYATSIVGNWSFI